MALSFPSNPSLNQQYTANGLTFSWNGKSWRTASPAAPMANVTGNAVIAALGYVPASNSTHLLPTVDDAYDLGASSYRWRDSYLSNAIRLGTGNAVIRSNAIVLDAGTALSAGQIPTVNASRLIARPFNYISNGNTITVAPSIDFFDANSVTRSIALDLSTGSLVFDAPGASFTGNLAISGNLVVSGNTTTVQSNVVEIGDAILTLNSDLPTNIAPTEDAGLSVNRGSSTAARWIWNEAADEWTTEGLKIGNVGTLSANSITANTVAAGSFVGNFSGSFTGNLDVSNVTGLDEAIDDRVGSLLIAGNGITLTYSDSANTLTVSASSATGNSQSIANTTVLRDANASFAANVITANSFVGALTGNADTATRLSTSRTISLSGDVSGSASFDGSANASVSATLANSGATAGTYSIATVTVDAKGRVTSASNGTISSTSISDFSEAVDDRVANLVVAGSYFTRTYDDTANTLTLSVSATSASTANTIVARDANGAFLANSITATDFTINGVADGLVESDSNLKVRANGNSTSLTFTARTSGGVENTALFANSETTILYHNGIKRLETTANGVLINTSVTATNFTGNFTGSFSGTIDNANVANVANSLATARQIALSGDVSGSTMFDGSANVSITASLANSGVTAGTYKSVTVDVKGRVTAGTNPTTLAGYGITDAVGTTGNQAISGDLTLSGNLVVNGSTVTVNSTTVTIDDPIFMLGGDTAATLDDNKDRGIAFQWHDGSAARLGFFGFDDSTGYFTFIPNATNTSEVFSGTAGSIQANLIGNADTATKLATARTIELSGDVSGSASFDGSANASITAALSNSGVTAGSYGSATAIPVITIDAKGRITVANTANVIALTANSLATARSIALSGDATGSTSFDGSADATISVTLANSGVSAGTYGNATLIPSITVDAKGRVTGVSTSAITAGTPDAVANTTVQRDANASFAANTVTANLAGNADTATKLATARTIALSGDVSGSASFDGSANASVTATLSNSGVTAGSYTNPLITIDSKGRVTSASNGTVAASSIENLDEAVDDRVSSLLVAGSNITLTYNDAANTLTIAATGASSNVAPAFSDTFTANGSQTSFTLSETVAAAKDIMVVVNGLVQVPVTDYTISGTTLTFGSTPDAESFIDVRPIISSVTGGTGGGTGTSGANTSLSNLANVAISTALLPATSNAIDIGSSALRFRSIYVNEAHLSANTLYIDGTPILQSSANTIVIAADPNQSLSMSTSGTGTITLDSAKATTVQTNGTNADVLIQTSGTGSMTRITSNTEVRMTAPTLQMNGNVAVANNITVAGNITISGNATINGTTTTIDTTNMRVEDNVVTINYGEAGTGVSLGTAGLQVDRGDLTDALFVFDETDDKWKTGLVGGSLNAVATESYVTSTISSSVTQRSVQTFVSNANQTSFTLSSSYVSGGLDVFVNGVRLSESEGDFTASGGTTFNVASGLAAGDSVVAVINGSTLTSQRFLREYRWNGALSSNTGTTRFYIHRAGTLTKVAAYLGTASSTGAAIAIRKNGTSVQTVTFASSATVAKVSPSIALAEDDYLTVDITTPGNGSDLSVLIEYLA